MITWIAIFTFHDHIHSLFCNPHILLCSHHTHHSCSHSFYSHHIHIQVQPPSCLSSLHSLHILPCFHSPDILPDNLHSLCMAQPPFSTLDAQHREQEQQGCSHSWCNP